LKGNLYKALKKVTSKASLQKKNLKTETTRITTHKSKAKKNSHSGIKASKNSLQAHRKETCKKKCSLTSKGIGMKT
jgi:hypothetical protein